MKKVKNWGRTCADCKWHECDTICTKRKKKTSCACTGKCWKKDTRKTCYASATSCKDFVFEPVVLRSDNE